MFRHLHITDTSNNIPPQYASFQRRTAASKLRTKQKPFVVPDGTENNPSLASVRSSNEFMVFPAKNNPFGLNGPWNSCEALAFLEGLESFGPGRWKKIAKLVPTRDNIQIKSRAQQILRKQKNGVPIFDDLKRYRIEGRGCGVSPRPPLIRACPPPPPASDVLQAACGLAMLEEKPVIFQSSSAFGNSLDPSSSIFGINHRDGHPYNYFKN